MKPHPWGAEEPWVHLLSHSPLSLFHAGFSLTGTCLMPSEQPAGEQPQACAGLSLLWILEGTATAAAGCMNPGPKTALLPTGGLWRARSLVSFPEIQDHSSALPTKLWSERLGPTSPLVLPGPHSVTVHWVLSGFTPVYHSPWFPAQLSFRRSPDGACLLKLTPSSNATLPGMLHPDALRYTLPPSVLCTLLIVTHAL